jgi:hypothetical protein
MSFGIGRTSKPRYMDWSGHSSGDQSWGCDPGLALLTQRRPHSVPRTGLEPVFPAWKAGVLTRLDHRGLKESARPLVLTH